MESTEKQEMYEYKIDSFASTDMQRLFTYQLRRVYLSYWLRSGFESQQRHFVQASFRIYQLWMLLWNDIKCALLILRSVIRSGFDSPRDISCKPFVGSYQLWTYHWSDIICALFVLRTVIRSGIDSLRDIWCKFLYGSISCGCFNHWSIIICALLVLRAKKSYQTNLPV